MTNNNNLETSMSFLTPAIPLGEANLQEEAIANTNNLLYAESFSLPEYRFSIKIADYLNRWTGLNIPNTYSYNSEKDFVTKIPFSGKLNLLDSSISFQGSKLGGNAGLDIAPSAFEVGWQFQAGYNLGQFDFNLPLIGSIAASIANNKLIIDIVSIVNSPLLNYAFPFAYIYLDAIFGYDVTVDLFGQGYVDIGSRFLNYKYEGEKSFNLVDVEGETQKRLIQLDTRSDNNFIDLIYKKINLGNRQQDTIPRGETEGFLGLNFNLPRFNGIFQSIPSLENEYIWQLKEEKKLVEANLSLDNFLAQIPFLKWLSKADTIDLFTIAGYDFALDYDWRALSLDLSASLSFGYDFQTGIKDLYPQLLKEKSDIDTLDLPAFSDLDRLLDYLESVDKDGERDIDIVLEFNPKIFFQADVYLKPEINFSWDIGIIKAQLSPLTERKEFTLFAGDTSQILPEKIPIIPLTKKEIYFKELYTWITGSAPNFIELPLEISFSNLAPQRYGSDRSDVASGTSGNDRKLLGKGDDAWFISEGNDTISGEAGIDTLIINRPENYNLISNTISDSIGNKTSFDGFEDLLLDGRKSTALSIVILGDLNDNSLPYLFGDTSDFNDTIQNSKIVTLNTGKGNDLVRGTLYGINEIGPRIVTQEGNDSIIVSKLAIAGTTEILTGSGDDALDLTILPVYSDREQTSLFKIDLERGQDTIFVRTAILNGTPARNAEILINGYIGGKTIDVALDAIASKQEVILQAKATIIRDLFGLTDETTINHLSLDIANSIINYNLDTNQTNLPQIQDKIIQAKRFKLDLTDVKLPTSIAIVPDNLTTSEFVIDSANSLTDIFIDTSKGVPATTTKIEITGNNTKVRANEINFLLSKKLFGKFVTLDLSGYAIDEGLGIYTNNDFVTTANLNIGRVLFTEGKDLIFFTPDAQQITTVGPDVLRNPEELMSFYLGGGDDVFHDRAGFRDSLIYPGLGNDFIYGAGGFDTVFYEGGSRLDYQFTVVDSRTVRVYNRKDDTTDTLIDVEEISFDGANELVFNPYYQGIEPNLAYTTFTLQVDKEFRNWNQPPFVYSPWTYLVPFGTTKINLTKEFLLGNVYDAEGELNKLTISYINLIGDSSVSLQLNTNDPNAGIWEITIGEGLNSAEQPAIIEYTIDDPLGSSQGNLLYIYPTEDLSYRSQTVGINLVTSIKSEAIAATPFNDFLSTSDGDDSIIGFEGDDLFDGAQGNDSLEGNIGNDTLYGREGNDRLDAGNGTDSLDGGRGDDFFVAALGEGKDTYNGGENSDLVSYETSNLSLEVDLATGVVKNNGIDEDNLLNVENFFAGKGNDLIFGSSQANVLNGFLGNDRLDGKEGRDLLEGREGNDTLNGGKDRDFLAGGNDNDFYIVKLEESAGDIIQDSEGNDRIQLLSATDTEVSLSLSQLSAGNMGLIRLKNDLFIDRDRDGAIAPEVDLIIIDFFQEFSSYAGNGFIEEIGNLAGTDILNFISNNLFLAPQIQNEPSSSNIALKFDRDFNFNLINLYQGQNNRTLADVSLIGESTGKVKGSLVWDNKDKILTFIKTRGLLAPDRYTLSLSAEAFVSDRGILLDGDGDGRAGGNFTYQFSVSESSSRILSLPNLTYAPGETLPQGIGISLDNLEGVKKIRFALNYDPNLLDITGVRLNPNLPNNWQLIENSINDGIVKITLAGSDPLTGNNLEVVNLQAIVPNNAKYGTTQLLDLNAVEVNDGAIAVVGDDGIHQLNILGDVTGNGKLTSLDVALLSRALLGLDSGADAFSAIDLELGGDFNGDNLLSSGDLVAILHQIVGLD
jgi:Ca2+-binding RTX toxin-like protein